MKTFKHILSFFAAAAIFAVSFAMGHAVAVRNASISNERIKQEAERAVAILPLLRASEAEPKEVFSSPAPEPESITVRTAAPGEEVEEEREEPPSQVPMPVNGSISARYSLQSVYSETMHDWRAHRGMDIDAPLTEAVSAVADGTVKRAYEDKLWGNVIEIEHCGGLTTVYKGVSTLSMVSVGKSVRSGDVISGVGTSPIESKAMPHLHFEAWQDGVCVNPEYIVKSN